MKCSIVATIRTKQPCTEEAVATNQFDHPVCAACLAECMHVGALLEAMAKKLNTKLLLPNKFNSSNN